MFHEKITSHFLKLKILGLTVEKRTSQSKIFEIRIYTLGIIKLKRLKNS